MIRTSPVRRTAASTIVPFRLRMDSGLGVARVAIRAYENSWDSIVFSQMRRDRGQGIAMRRYRVVSNEFKTLLSCASFSA